MHRTVWELCVGDLFPKLSSNQVESCKWASAWLQGCFKVWLTLTLLRQRHTCSICFVLFPPSNRESPWPQIQRWYKVWEWRMLHAGQLHYLPVWRWSEVLKKSHQEQNKHVDETGLNNFKQTSSAIICFMDYFHPWDLRTQEKQEKLKMNLSLKVFQLANNFPYRKPNILFPRRWLKSIDLYNEPDLVKDLQRYNLLPEFITKT